MFPILDAASDVCDDSSAGQRWSAGKKKSGLEATCTDVACS